MLRLKSFKLDGALVPALNFPRYGFPAESEYDNIGIGIDEFDPIDVGFGNNTAKDDQMCSLDILIRSYNC